MMVMIMAIAMALTTAAMPAFAAAPQGYTITSGGVCSSRRISDKVVPVTMEGWSSLKMVVIPQCSVPQCMRRLECGSSTAATV